VLAVVLVLDGDVDRREPAAHRVAGRDAENLDGRTSSRPTPDRRRRDRRRSPSRPTRATGGCPTRSRPARGQKHAGRHRRGRARGSTPGGSSRPATSAAASSSSCTRPGNASLKNPEMRTTTSMRGRPSSARRDGLDAGEASRLLVPAGPDAEERERLGDVVALRAHGRCAPDHEADGLGRGAVLGDVTGDELLCEPAADVPGQRRRPATSGRRSRSSAPSAGRAPCRGSARRWAPRARSRPSSPCRRLATSSGVRRSAGRSRSQTQRSVGSESPSRQVVALQGGEAGRDSASRPRRRRRAVRGRRPARAPPSRAATARRRWAGGVIASTRSSSASPSGARPQRVQSPADLRVLQLAQVAVDVQQEVVELVVVRRLGAAEVPVDLCVDEQVPHLRPHARDLRRGRAPEPARARRAAAPAGRARRRRRRG